MKINAMLFCFVFYFFANSFTAAKAQVNVTDSLALVDLYNSTNGPRWQNHKNWLSVNPVSTWYGVVVTTERVTNLSLGDNRLYGTLPSSIGNLTHLEILYLAFNFLSGSLPVSIGNLASLKQLDLSQNRLSGAIPAEIGNLSNLQNLFLNYNQLTGAIPKEIGNLSNLKFLYLIHNQLSGSIPAEIGNLANLQNIILLENQLTGTIPAEIGNLANLQGFNVETNQLSGAIPAEIGKLTNLTSLNLEFNQFSGAIPAEIGKLVNLTTLDLEFNQLSGAIPAEIGKLAILQKLFLNYNQLTGAIPADIFKLVYLQDLALNNNQLTGAIPADIGKLVKLRSLVLDNNQLTGPIPSALSKLKELDYVDVSHNLLSQDKNIQFPLYKNFSITGYINYNLFNFNGLEYLAGKYPYINYAPQNTILPIHQNGNLLSVSAGGTLSNNTYYWFKVGKADSITITGDSTFTPSASGSYYAKVKNAIATRLTLYTDTVSYTAPLQSNATFLAENTAQIKNADSKLLVYPNPAKDVIHVQVNGNAMIVVSNSTGKVLLSKTINNSGEINVSSYANGIYYLQNKNTGETQKVIVVH